MRRIVFLLVLTTAIFGAIAPFCLQTRYYSLASPLRKFYSYEELKSFVKASLELPYYYWGLPDSALLRPSFSLDLKPNSLESYALKSSVPEYSTTNIQVEGVDEADVVKTDGEYIYVVSGGNVTILRAYPAEDAEVLSQIRLNGTVKGVFINGDRLVLFEEASEISVKVYDISNREIPVLKRPVSMSGRYVNSRMIGDYVYVVITEPAYFVEDEVSLPVIEYSDAVKEIYASEIYYSDVPDYSYGFTTILAVNVQNDEEEPTHETFMLGATSGMYVSLTNIYITFPQSENTRIYRFHIQGSEIASAADGEVPGYVLNQFSMDEYEGYFRVATTTGHVAKSSTQASSQNHVYILNMNLTIVGRLEDLAPGEKIHSARFMGPRCYLVTFRKVDPLFVIDLEDPYNPQVLGKLKIPGYSDYLHPYDENHVIGIGKETVASEEGDFSWYQGVKISLFDVSDVENPKEMDKYEIGDRGTESPVLSDHKAFLFDRSRNLLVLPVLVAEIDEEKYPGEPPPNTYGEYVFQGAYVFHISLTEKIVLKGRITHLENDNDLMKSGHYFFSPYAVKRSLYIGNVLYTISDKKIKMNNLENLDEINAVELP
ncbi:MAG: beta-propeller domain-containing protein [Candidatus Bathyarchaeia archaeon]